LPNYTVQKVPYILLYIKSLYSLAKKNTLLRYKQIKIRYDFESKTPQYESVINQVPEACIWKIQKYYVKIWGRVYTNYFLKFSRQIFERVEPIPGRCQIFKFPVEPRLAI
jgi:ribosomal protein S24E